MGRGSGKNSSLDTKKILFDSKSTPIARAADDKNQIKLVPPAVIGQPAIPIANHNPDFKIKDKEIICLNKEPVKAKAPKHLIATLNMVKEDFPSYYSVCNSCQAMHAHEEAKSRDEFLQRYPDCEQSTCPGGKKFAFDFYDVEEFAGQLQKQSSAYHTMKALLESNGQTLPDVSFEIKIKDCYVYSPDAAHEATMNQLRENKKSKKEKPYESGQYYDHTNYLDEEVSIDIHFGNFDTHSIGYIPAVRFRKGENSYAIPLHELEFVEG